MFGFEDLGFDFDVSPDVEVDTGGYTWGDWGEQTEGVSVGAETGHGSGSEYDGSDFVLGDAGSVASGSGGDVRNGPSPVRTQAPVGSGTSTFDKVMQTLEKNPKLAAALVQGAGGLIAGAGAGYAAKNRQEWEDRKIQEAWERRRMEAKPGTLRKENWGGLIQTAGK